MPSVHSRTAPTPPPDLSRPVASSSRVHAESRTPRIQTTNPSPKARKAQNHSNLSQSCEGAPSKIQKQKYHPYGKRIEANEQSQKQINKITEASVTNKDAQTLTQTTANLLIQSARCFRQSHTLVNYHKDAQQSCNEAFDEVMFSLLSEAQRKELYDNAKDNTNYDQAEIIKIIEEGRSKKSSRNTIAQCLNDKNLCTVEGLDWNRTRVSAFRVAMVKKGLWPSANTTSSAHTPPPGPSTDDSNLTAQVAIPEIIGAPVSPGVPANPEPPSFNAVLANLPLHPSSKLHYKHEFSVLQTKFTELAARLGLTPEALKRYI